MNQNISEWYRVFLNDRYLKPIYHRDYERFTTVLSHTSKLSISKVRHGVEKALSRSFQVIEGHLYRRMSIVDFRYNRVEIDKEIEQMKKDDSYKEDEDFESNYYRANKIKVKKVIVQGQSSKLYKEF